MFFLEDLFNSYKTIETAWERFKEGLFWEVGILNVLLARSNSLLVKPLSSLPNIIAKFLIFVKDIVQLNTSSKDSKDELLVASILPEVARTKSQSKIAFSRLSKILQWSRYFWPFNALFFCF